MKFLVLSALLLSSCSTAISYKSPVGQSVKVEWTVAIPVVNTTK